MRKALLAFAAHLFVWSASVAIDVVVGLFTFAFVTLPRWRWEWQQLRGHRDALPESWRRQFRRETFLE